ncbi:MAG: radical SAM protein [Dysgonamonadaceae bacterium]|jgi:hypothetical protein|nr:radical SAM protein [Dysgonamonadaceae bacterium]
MRWVLIKPLHYSPFYDPEIQEPLGMEYLASSLKTAGCTVLLLDGALDKLDNTKTGRRTAAFQPDAVGFSITTDHDLDSLLAIYNECKNLLGEKPVFWIAGGNFVTTEPEYASESLPDEMHLMRFEADISIRDIVHQWREKALDSLPRRIDAVPPAFPDELPFPARPFYATVLQYGWAFNVQGSRGCCSACKYCASRGMRGSNPAWRGRSPENIVRELEWLAKQYGAQTFNFVDEDFLGPPSNARKRAKDFADGIGNKGLKINFGIQIRPNSLTTETIDSLYKAGLRYVFMGIESDNPSDFKHWGRQYCADAWHWVEHLQSLGIEVNAGTLLFHSESTVEGIRNFAGKLRQYHLLNYRTAVNRLDAMPGSFFHNEYIAATGDAGRGGCITLPFNKQPELEFLYRTVTDVLAPVEIPSMHALCVLPTAQTNKLFNNDEASFRLLKDINAECDDRVASCFFEILDMFEKKNLTKDRTDELKSENLLFGWKMIDRLASNGFVRSPEPLYEAMQRFNHGNENL